VVLIAIRVACVAAVERGRGLRGKEKRRGVGFSPSCFSPPPPSPICACQELAPKFPSFWKACHVGLIRLPHFATNFCQQKLDQDIKQIIVSQNGVVYLFVIYAM